MLEKVHHIQNMGIEVTCGMIVGFDNDDEKVFAAQRRFLGESRVILALVNILSAIPMTPLHTRLMKEGRLDETGDRASLSTINTNVIPLRMSKRRLCDGFIDLMRDLYAPEAYFARMDALYLESNYLPNIAHRRYLRQHPWYWFTNKCRYVVETTYMFVQLMRLVPDKRLRAEYRRNLWKVITRRPDLALLRTYCFKCAMHFHYDQLVRRFAADRAALAPDLTPVPIPTVAERLHRETVQQDAVRRTA